MAEAKKFQSDPFWDYSLATYARPGVAAAGIALQDEYGLDVNLLLACLWYAAEGPGRLQSEHIRECLNRTRDWQLKVVQPLRKLRRFCKDEPAHVPQALRKTFRPGLQAVELDAEHVEQLVLSETLRPLMNEGKGSEASGAPARAGADAIQNLLAYIALQGVTLDARVAELLSEIVAAVFPDADLSALVTPA
jgi:uncharacterized protein (TIGR02444 family)